MGAFLMLLAGPLARQVLISLGIGLVTTTGLSLAITGILGQAKSAWQGGLVGVLGGNVGELVAMAGGNVALSIIAGAMVTRLSLMVFKKFVPQ